MEKRAVGKYQMSENQKEYWNSAAETKEFTTPFQLDQFSEYVREEQSILDVGCGYGRIMQVLDNAGYRNLVGIDFSEKLIQRGSELNPNLKFELQTDQNLPFQSDCFDAVILVAVLTCIVENADQQYLISEIKRVLKPNGTIYVNDFLLNDDERNKSRYHHFASEFETFGTFRLEEGAVLRHHEESHIKTLLSCFTELRYETLLYPTMNGHWSNGFYFIGGKADTVKKLQSF